MHEIWVPIVVAVISTGILGTLVKVVVDWIRGKHKDEDDAWKQRDAQRRRADKLHEALMKHRTWCHKEHGVPFDEMPKFPTAE